MIWLLPVFSNVSFPHHYLFSLYPFYRLGAFEPVSPLPGKLPPAHPGLLLPHLQKFPTHGGLPKHTVYTSVPHL